MRFAGCDSQEERAQADVCLVRVGLADGEGGRRTFHSSLSAKGSGFRVQGLGFRVQGSEFRVEG